MKNNNEKPRIPPIPVFDAASELVALLLNLPPAPKRTRGYKEVDLQVHISGELGQQLRALSKAITRGDMSGSGYEVGPHTASSFQAETLVSYLLTEFLAGQRAGVDMLLARLSARERQDQLDEQTQLEAAIDSLLD
jgi:hypothetical protein